MRARARFTWNLAVEQHAHWHPGRKSAPRYLEQCRQLTAARAERQWLRQGCQMVQQQALRDFAQAMAAFFDPENRAGRPSWREASPHRATGKSWAWTAAWPFPRPSRCELLTVPTLTCTQRKRLLRLERKLARAMRNLSAAPG